MPLDVPATEHTALAPDATEHTTNATDEPAHKMLAEVDVIQRLKLKDPAKETTVEALGPIAMPDSEPANAMLKGELSDPQKFANTVKELYDRASASQEVPLRLSTIEKDEKDPALTPQERAAAAVMYENFGSFAGLASDSMANRIFGGLVPSSFKHLNSDDLKALTSSAEGYEASRRHPELHNPKVLASVVGSMWNRLDHDYGDSLNIDGLYKAAASDKFSDQERAAALLLAENYYQFASLDGSHNSPFGLDDLSLLAKLGPEPAPVDGKCPEPRDSVAGNAIVLGLAAGLISAALGSKQSVRNGLAAAVTAAAVTGVENQGPCPGLPQP